MENSKNDESRKIEKKFPEIDLEKWNLSIAQIFPETFLYPDNWESCLLEKEIDKK